MKIYALTRADGGVSIMYITPEGLAAGATVESELAKWHPDAAAEIVSHREIAAKDLPADRAYRDAWTADLTVDQAKASEIAARAMPAERITG